MKRGLLSILAISNVTFLEIIREKILYNTALAGLILFVVGNVASRLSFVSPERVLINVGVALVAASSLIVAVLVSANLLNREFERKTFLVSMSRPISRGQFVVGKCLGICSVLCVNWLSIILFFFLILKLFKVQFTSSVMMGCLLYLMQGVVAAIVTLFYSSFASSAMAIVLSVGTYLVGSNLSQLKTLIILDEVPFTRFAYLLIQYCFPNFEIFSAGTKITYGLPIGIQYMFGAIGYGFVLGAVFLLLTSILIRDREL